jgi:Family of unknown function (DUF5329)
VNYSLPFAALVLGALLVMPATAKEGGSKGEARTTLPLAARVEIESLLSRLKASGCQFNRNGSWHTSEEAQAHLLRKLDYLAGTGAIASADQFIELAATKSSVTGQAYSVKCGSNAPVQSSTWLFSQLQTLRSNSAAPAPSPK